mgnify:CR=1 FL=1|jgi:hypothetical protein
MPKNKWKNQFTTIEANSKFHNGVREIFATDSFFRNMSCYQEVPVWELAEGYYARNQHYDWYIEELNLIIELHGAQHYKVVNYGNIGAGEAERSFRKQQERDNNKMQAALNAGYRYKEIHYRHRTKLTPALIKQLVLYDNED